MTTTFFASTSEPILPRRRKPARRQPRRTKKNYFHLRCAGHGCVQSSAGSHRNFARDFPVGGQLIDDPRQVLAQTLKQLVARQAGMFHQRVDLVGAECVGQIARSDCLVGSAADPRIGLFVEARLLKLLEQVFKPPLRTLPAVPPARRPPSPPLSRSL